MGILIPITIMAALGIAYWWATVHDRKRREKLIELAQSLGLQISWELSPSDAERFRRFAVSKLGHTQNVKTVLCADSGETRMVVFDYEYIKGHGKHRICRIFSMVLCTDPRFKSPKLSLEPEAWHSVLADLTASIGSHLGVMLPRDIDFSEAPDFSSAFRLCASDEKLAREFMNETRRQALMAHPKVRLEIDGDALLVMRPHFRLTADSIREYMAEALAATQFMVD